MTPVPDAKLSLEILIISAESTFRLPALIVPLETISPDGYKAKVWVSLSDDRPYALAFVVISAVPAEWVKPNE